MWRMLERNLLLVGVANLCVGFSFWSIPPSNNQDLPNLDEDDDDDSFRHLRVEDVEDLKKYYDTLTQETLHAIKEAEHVPSNSGSANNKRSRRSLLHGQPMTDENGVYRLQKVEPLFPMCKHAINVQFLDFENETYAVCVSATTTITLGKIYGQGWHPVASWEVKQPRQAAIFADRGLIYIVATDADNPDGTELLMYTKTTNHVLLDHTIHSRQATAIAVWAMEPEGKYHLAIANSPGPESTDFHDRTYLYDWTGTYFDKYSSLRSYDVHDLEPFHIHSNVFLAVANHRVSISNYHIDSEIFKYDINKKKWKSFQRIRTYAASDWEFFALGENNEREFFLAVANQFDFIHGYRKYDVNSVIYKYVENKFVPYQCIQTSGATHIAALKGPRQEFILAVSNYYQAVQLYQYNGWKFVLSSVQYTQGSMGPGAISLVAHYLHDSRIGLAVSNPVLEQETNLYALSFQHENKLQNWYRQSVSWCKSAKHKADSIPTPLVLTNLSSLPRIDQETPIHLPGDLILDNDAALLGSLQTTQLHDLATGSVFDHSILHRLENLDHRLRGINDKIRKMKDYLLGALRLSGDQTVTGEYNFHSALFSCEAGDGCEATSLHTSYLNGENVENLARNVILKSINNEVPIPLEFQHVQARDAYVGGLLSGINTSNIVTRSGNHFLRAPTIFHSPVQAESVVVSGLADGVLISPDNILLDHGDQTVTGKLIFNEIGTENLQVDQHINNIQLNDFYEDVVLDGAKQMVQAPMVIVGDVVVDNLMMHPGAKVNNIDFVDLWNNVLWKDGFQEIHAPMNFTSLYLENPLASTINGLAIPGPEVILLHTAAEVRGPKTFQSTSSIDNMNVLGSLNGLKVLPDSTSGWPNQLDVMVRSLPQTVFGHKTFPSIHLDGHSTVGGNVQDVNIQQLAANVVKLNATQEFPDTWVFNKADFHGPLEVLGNVEGWNLAEMFHKALKLSQPLPRHSTVVFKNLAQIGSLNCHDLNGIDVSKDLVTKDGNQVIYGTKHLTDAFLVGDSILHGLVNGVNLGFLHDCMLTHGDQVFLEPKQIANDLIVSNMMVGGHINGVPFSSFVSLNRDEVLLGAMTLENPVVNKLLHAFSLQFAGTVNNITFRDLVQDTMTYSDYQDVHGHKNILGNLTLVDGSNLETPNLNGIDLGIMAAEVAFHDLPQTITGRKTFTNLVHFDHLHFFGSLDGVSNWDMMHNWMLQDVSQTIFGDLVVNGDVFVNAHMSSGHVNDLNLVHLNNTIAKVNEPAEFTGRIHMKDAVLEQGLDLTGKIQGIDLSEEAVLRFGDNVIWGRKHYAKGMDVNGNLMVKGYVDGLKVSELCEHAVRRYGDQHLKSLMINGNLEVNGGLRVGGLVDGVDLVLLNATALKLDEAISNEHPFAFDTLHISGPLTVHGQLNGIDLTYLMNSYMSLTKDQEVDSSVVFQSPVFIKGPLGVGSVTTASKLVNGVDVMDLSNSVLKTVGDQMIQARYIFEKGLVFDKDLHANKINGLTIPDDLMLKGRENVVSGPVTFADDVHVRGNLGLGNGAPLQNIDVVDWARNAVYKQGNFNLTGNKVLENCAIEDAWFHSTLNGMTISPESVLLAFGDQEMHGNTHFKKGVRTNANFFVGGLVNGIELDKFRRDAVTRNGENVILGAKSFVAPVTMDQLLVHGTVDGVNLTDLGRKIGEPKLLDDIKSHLQNLEGQIAEMGTLLREQAVSFSYYKLAQEMSNHMQVRKWHFLPIHNEIEFLLVYDALKDQMGCTAVRILQYRYPARQFVPFAAQISLPANYVVDIKSALTKEAIWMFVGNANPVSCIQREQGTLHIYKWNSNGFDLKQIAEELPIRSLAPFVFNEDICVAVHVHEPRGASPIHLYCHEQSGFRLLQKLPITSANQITSLVCKDKSLLAITSQYSTDIYSWSGQKPTPLKLIQRIPGPAARVSCTSDAEHCYLAVSENAVLSVFRYEEPIHSFALMQKWELDDTVLNIQWAILPSFSLQHFLLVLTRRSQHNLQVLKLQGVSGFVPYLQLTIPDATDIYSFARAGSMEHYLAVISESCENNFWHQAGPRGLLLKSKIKGRQYHN